MGEENTNERLGLLEQKVIEIGTTTRHVAEGQAVMGEKIDQMVETLQVLARIEERTIASNQRVEQIAVEQRAIAERVRAIEIAMPENADKRLSSIEVAMPQLKEARRWVVSGVLAGVGMIGVALVSLVVR